MALQHCSSNAERSCASGLQGLTIPNDLPNNCNYSDLCSDRDAIKLAAMLKGSGADDPNLLSRTLRSYYNNPVSLLQRFKAISESVGASDERTAKDKFFAEIDDLLDDIYVGLLTDGSNGAYGYSGVAQAPTKKSRFPRQFPTEISCVSVLR